MCTLNNNNSYNGATTVTAGTLQLGATFAVPLNSPLTVNSVLDLNNYSPIVDGLSGSGTITSVIGGSPSLTIGNNNGGGTFSGSSAGQESP